MTRALPGLFHVTDFGDWLSDVTGIGKSERKAAEKYNGEADALTKKYDEAHKKKYTPTPNRKKSTA